MKKNIKIISAAIIVFIIIFGFFVALHSAIKPIVTTNSLKQTENTNTASTIKQTQATETILEINDVKYVDEITAKTSVYDFMSKLRSEGKINFKEKNYLGMGEFIVSINGVTGNNQKSWIYYVNGKEAQVGISNYKINPGDIVSWKYEKSNY